MLKAHRRLNINTVVILEMGACKLFAQAVLELWSSQVARIMSMSISAQLW
jgi:hypothetical protein